MITKAKFLTVKSCVRKSSRTGIEIVNGLLLQAVHGMGNVTKQAIHFKEIQGVLHRKGNNRTNQTDWSVRMITCQPGGANCGTAGALKPISASIELLMKTEASSPAVLRKALHVKLGKQKLYSEEYPRMRQRVCHVVLLDDGRLASVKHFILNVETKCIFALVSIIQRDHSSLQQAGNHLVLTKETGNLISTDVVSVNSIREKLLYIDTGTGHVFVAQIPNLYGRSVFKWNLLTTLGIESINCTC